MGTAAGRALWILTAAAGLWILGAVAWLLADATGARLHAPAEAELVARLEERVRTDPEAAAALEAERRRQTEGSLRREKRHRRLGWVLLIASAVFVTGAKELVGLRPVSEGRVDVSAAAGRPSKADFQSPSGGLTSMARGFIPVPNGADSREPEPEIDPGFLDNLIARRGRRREAAIPILQAIQSHYGYLPDAELRRTAEGTESTLAELAGTASFYTAFRRSPMGRHRVRLCHGTACHVAGAEHVAGELRRRLGIPAGADTDPGRRFTLDPVACLGCCSLAPVMMIGEETAGHLTPMGAWETLSRQEAS